MTHHPTPPFKVVRVDQFDGHSEDGYSSWGHYDRLEDAIAIAQMICEKGIQHCGSFKNWYGMGDAGLVYDSTHELVWDGIKEYALKYKEK
jgi:hypothetical protein